MTPSLCVLEWSGWYDDVGSYCELDGWTAIRHANPGLGYVIGEAAIAGDPARTTPECYS